MAAAQDPGSLGPQTSYRGYMLGFSSVTWGLTVCPPTPEGEACGFRLGCSLQSRGTQGWRPGWRCICRHFAQIEISVPGGARATSSTCHSRPRVVLHPSYHQPHHSDSCLPPPGHSAFCPGCKSSVAGFRTQEDPEHTLSPSYSIKH